MRYPKLLMLGAGATVTLAACGTPAVTVNPIVGEGPARLPAGITVAGVGEVTGTPDTLSMRFGVSVIRPSVSEAVAVAGENADDLIASLQTEGVAIEDIQTANYSIHPEYDFPNDERVLRGYRVQNTVTAKIRDLDAAGAVIDSATAAVGDEITVNGVWFAIEDDEELLEAARAAAWEDARAKAEQLAVLADVTLGSPIAVSESLAGGPPIVAPLARAGAAEFLETPIEPGQQTLSVNLSVQFGINR